MSRLVSNPHQLVFVVILVAMVFMVGYIAGESNERHRVAAQQPLTVASSGATK
ncbi:hypothetical protein [Acidovorax sp.]|jgi:hypothetical protein|uniref:hypothetical protein n=1 Tax=Acidovorax sp. TaxID=1872122 RepID=UPI0025C20797|nr:hypothetical protein [Acidovorax sp.]